MKQSPMNSDFEFYSKRLKTEGARQSTDYYQSYVHVSVFEDIIIHISRRLDGFEQKLQQLENNIVYNDDILKLIRDEYKQFSSIYKTSVSDIKSDIEIHSKYIKQLEKAMNDNTTFLNDLSSNIVQKEEIMKQNREINFQMETFNNELQTFISSANKNNQFMVLKTKEMELQFDNIKMNSLSQQTNQFDYKENVIAQSHQFQKKIEQLREEQSSNITKLQSSIEKEVEWIKVNLIRVIDLVLQQNQS